MPVTVTPCPQGHEIRSSADRTRQGFCRECQRNCDRRNRMKNRAALDVVRIFEAAGAVFQVDGVPVAAEDVAAQLVRLYGNEIS